MLPRLARLHDGRTHVGVLASYAGIEYLTFDALPDNPAAKALEAQVTTFQGSIDRLVTSSAAT